MENQDSNTNKGYKNWKDRSDNRSGRVMGGLVLILVGVVLLAYKMNIVFLPRWVFSWQMIPILVGLFIGFRHSFRNPGWILPVALGVLFLVDEYVPGISFRNYLWPIVIIVIGLWVMLKPKHDRRPRFVSGLPTMPPRGVVSNETTTNNATAADGANYAQDHLDSTAIFGGVKRNVISKNFIGGEVVSVFGGNEINLSQADIQQPIVIDTVQVFGGTSLIIPPHWEVKSEVVAILGGISDKRPILPGGYDPNKVVILKGTALFGGLDIKSY